MPSITMTIELDETFLYDVLTTAVESSAIAYWAICSEVSREVDTNIVISATLEDLAWHNDHRHHDCSVHDMIMDEPEFTHEEIDLDTIVKGIQRVLGKDEEGVHVECAEYIHDYITRGVREMDAGDIDAEACDVIIQAAVFGELVYG